MIDSLNQKNKALSDKLGKNGYIRIPQTEFEKKIFYSKNDKILEGCSLINQIHDQIRAAFRLAQPGSIMRKEP